MPEFLTRAGIDLKKWIDCKAMDFLSMSYLTNNYNQVVEPWLSWCRKKNIPFYPSVEVNPAFSLQYFRSLISNPLAPAHNHNIKLPTATLVTAQRAMAQNFLGQGADGIYMFNYPCLFFIGERVFFNNKPAFKNMASVLSQMGSLRTMANRDKHYTFYENLPIWIESNRPPQYHQTIPFHVFGKDLGNANVALRFRQIAERNPHAYGKYRQNPFVRPGVIHYSLNGEEITETNIKRTRQPAGKLLSGFQLKRHELIEITVPKRILVSGQNLLAFHIPQYPKDRDPYVYIYELEADLNYE